MSTFVVTATRDGFLEKYRNPGDVFMVTEEQFSSFWMERGGDLEPAPKRAIEKQARQEALASGGANAALEIALQDLNDERQKVTEQADKIAELEAKLVELQGPVQTDAPEAAADGEASTEDAPPDAVPVQRVRRTPAPE